LTDNVYGDHAALVGTHRGIYKTSTGVAPIVNELVSALTTVRGPPAGVRRAPPRAGDVLRACVDPSKAGRDRLWRSRTALSDGLRLTALAEGADLQSDAAPSVGGAGSGGESR